MCLCVCVRYKPVSKPEKVGGGDSLRIACGHQMFTCNKKRGEGEAGKESREKKRLWFTGVGGDPKPKA